MPLIGACYSFLLGCRARSAANIHKICSAFGFTSKRGFVPFCNNSILAPGGIFWLRLLSHQLAAGNSSNKYAYEWRLRRSKIGRVDTEVTSREVQGLNARTSFSIVIHFNLILWPLFCLGQYICPIRIRNPRNHGISRVNGGKMNLWRRKNKFQ